MAGLLSAVEQEDTSMNEFMVSYRVVYSEDKSAPSTDTLRRTVGILEYVDLTTSDQ